MALSVVTRPLILALVLLGVARTSTAAFCAPGQGIKKFDILSTITAVLGGGAPRAAPTCQPCGFGSVSPGGQDAECQMCVPFVSSPNFLKTSCDCLPGSYMGSKPDSWSTAVKNCTACPENHISTTRNARSCIQCPEGATAEGEKCVCAAGYAATGIDSYGVTGCTACSSNEVSPGGLSQSCTACEAGAYPLEDKSACGCAAGKRLSSSEPLRCTDCSTVFEYSATTNRMLMCMQCHPFSYANEDHTGCECAAGYYTTNPEAKAVVCRQCPEGTFKAAPGNGNVTSCIACPAGLVASGSRKSCVVPPCPAGTEKAADGSCVQCADTHFNYMRDGKCQACKNNTRSNPGRTNCDVCAHGAFQTSQPGDELSCMSCMFGFKWDASVDGCVEDPTAAIEADPQKPSIPSQQPVAATPPTNPELPGAAGDAGGSSGSGGVAPPEVAEPAAEEPKSELKVQRTAQGGSMSYKLTTGPGAKAATAVDAAQPVAPTMPRRFSIGLRGVSPDKNNS